MKVEVKFDADKAHKLIAQVSGQQLNAAMADALNDAAFEGRRVLQDAVRSSFDRPTPFITRAVQVVRRARPGRLEAEVGFAYPGGKAVDPERVIQAQVFGGRRGDKGAERALQRAGILPRGYAIVPGEACPLDQYGNVRGSFVVQLITYFRAAGEQGYKANMTDKRRAKLQDKGRTASGFMATRGVRYFVAYGRLRSGPTQHLHPGIWSATGTHDIDIKPILMFVRQPTYRQRLDMFGKPVQAALAKFDTRLRYRLRLAIEKAAR